MLPTSYRGDAIIDGEPIDAELQLDGDDLWLTIGEGDEVLRWPLTSFDIEVMKEGNYRLQRGDESFLFSPAVDDGLGEELSLRRRFSNEQAGGSPEPTNGTIADRVRDAGRGSHRRPRALRSLKLASLRAGRDLSLGAAVLILGILTLFVLSVALLSGAFSGGVAEESPAPASTEAATPPATDPATVAPTTVPEPPTTAANPTVASATVTTLPAQPEPVASDLSAFSMTPEQAIARWDALARPLSATLLSADVEVGPDSFAFTVSPFVRISGAVTDGLISRVVFTGDPSGTREDDRDVLSALGLTVAIVEPSLPPEGRRQLISSLGLDLGNPVLADLDGALDYLDNTYSLRWDEQSQLVVFEVSPVRSAPEEDGDADGS